MAPVTQQVAFLARQGMMAGTGRGELVEGGSNRQTGRWEGQSPGATHPVPCLSIIQSLCLWQVPTIIPVIMLLASFYLVLAPIIEHPQTEFLYIFLFLLSGIPVYFLLVYFRCQPKWLQMATLYLQLLLEVAPTVKNVD